MMNLLDQVNTAVSNRLGEHQQSMLAAGTSVLRSQQHVSLLELRATTAEAQVRKLQATLTQVTAEAEKQLRMQHYAVQSAQAEASVANAKLQLFLNAVGGGSQPMGQTNQPTNQPMSQPLLEMGKALIYGDQQLQERKSQDDSPRGLPLAGHVRQILFHPPAT